MPKIYLSSSTHPLENLATEYTLFQNKEEALFLWVNQPSVILGRNQNALSEVNHDFIKKNHILLARRLTGGGCVYHDLGNLNYTFISASNNQAAFLEIIKDALTTFGIYCEKSGRNDLLLGNRKISGTAYLCENDYYLFHGTLLVDVNSEHLEKALTPSIKKFEGKGIQSVKKRVANLSDYQSEISVSRLKDAIVASYQKKYPDATVQKANMNPVFFSQLSHRQWIYNTMDETLLTIERKFPNAFLELRLKVKDNMMTEVHVFSDSLDVSLSKKIENKLIHQMYTNLDLLLEEFSCA